MASPSRTTNQETPLLSMSFVFPPVGLGKGHKKEVHTCNQEKCVAHVIEAKEDCEG